MESARWDEDMECRAVSPMSTTKNPSLVVRLRLIRSHKAADNWAVRREGAQQIGVRDPWL